MSLTYRVSDERIITICADNTFKFVLKPSINKNHFKSTFHDVKESMLVIEKISLDAIARPNGEKIFTNQRMMTALMVMMIAGDNSHCAQEP